MKVVFFFLKTSKASMCKKFWDLFCFVLVLISLAVDFVM